MKGAPSRLAAGVLAAVMLLLLPPRGVPAAAAEGADAASNEAVIFAYLTGELGLNTAAACGVLANIERESGFDPQALEYGYTWESGGGFGICQWTNTPRTAETGRRTSLVTWCGENGWDYTALEGQLAYLAHELAGAYYDRLVTAHLREVPDTAGGAYQAGYRWCYYFEVPAGYDTGVSDARGTLARAYWARYAPLYARLTPGDLDADGVADSTDARMVLQYEVGLRTLTPAQLLAADVSGDDAVDSSDARMILQAEVGLLTLPGAETLMNGGMT